MKTETQRGGIDKQKQLGPERVGQDALCTCVCLPVCACVHVYGPGASHR